MVNISNVYIHIKKSQLPLVLIDYFLKEASPVQLLTKITPIYFFFPNEYESIEEISLLLYVCDFFNIIGMMQ